MVTSPYLSLASFKMSWNSCQFNYMKQMAPGVTIADMGF